MNYEQRKYRKLMDNKRFRSFVVKHLETNLWIGISPESFTPELPSFCKKNIIHHRKELDDFIRTDEMFRTSLVPLPFNNQAPEIAKEMYISGQNSDIGPMASVAGAFADTLGHEILKLYSPKELIIENGGDIFVYAENDLKVAIFAGHSPLSEKIGILVPKEITPVGICTSSATVGPSLSFGVSDATMIVCKKAASADGYATRFGNMIHSENDIQQVLEKIRQVPDIISAIIVCKEKFGITGKLKLELFDIGSS
jgi:uncharacterized protein